MNTQKNKKLTKIILKSCAYVAVILFCYKLPSILNNSNYLNKKFNDINFDD